MGVKAIKICIFTGSAKGNLNMILMGPALLQDQMGFKLPWALRLVNTCRMTIHAIFIAGIFLYWKGLVWDRMGDAGGCHKRALYKTHL